MQETVRNSGSGKSVYSTFLEFIEEKEKQAQDERRLQEEKYLRRTQRIYDFHERQRREAVELRRCLNYVSQHAHVLESVLRGAGTGGAGGEGGEVPLSAALARQASTLQRCMAQCVANAASIRRLLTAAHRPQMDNMIAKMEAELSSWNGFLQRAVNATCDSEVVIDNLHNMIAEQRRYVREVSNCNAFLSLCSESPEGGAGAAAGGGEAGGDEAGAYSPSSTPAPERRPLPAHMCSISLSPIAKD